MRTQKRMRSCICKHPHMNVHAYALAVAADMFGRGSRGIDVRHLRLIRGLRPTTAGRSMSHDGLRPFMTNTHTQVDAATTVRTFNPNTPCPHTHKRLAAVHSGNLLKKRTSCIKTSRLTSETLRSYGGTRRQTSECDKSALTEHHEQQEIENYGECVTQDAGPLPRSPRTIDSRKPSKKRH